MLHSIGSPEIEPRLQPGPPAKAFLGMNPFALLWHELNSRIPLLPKSNDSQGLVRDTPDLSLLQIARCSRSLDPVDMIPTFSEVPKTGAVERSEIWSDTLIALARAHEGREIDSPAKETHSC